MYPLLHLMDRVSFELEFMQKSCRWKEIQCGLTSKLELTYKPRATFSFYLLPAKLSRFLLGRAGCICCQGLHYGTSAPLGTSHTPSAAGGILMRPAYGPLQSVYPIALRGKERNKKKLFLSNCDLDFWNKIEPCRGVVRSFSWERSSRLGPVHLVAGVWFWAQLIAFPTVALHHISRGQPLTYVTFTFYFLSPVLTSVFFFCYFCTFNFYLTFGG